MNLDNEIIGLRRGGVSACLLDPFEVIDEQSLIGGWLVGKRMGKETVGREISFWNVTGRGRSAGVQD